MSKQLSMVVMLVLVGVVLLGCSTGLTRMGPGGVNPSMILTDVVYPNSLNPNMNYRVNMEFSDLEFLLAFFVKLVGFFSFCLFLGILVKRSAFALGFLIIWAILEQVIFGILGWKFVSWDAARTIKGFLPLESMARLIKEPATRLNAVQSVADQIGEQIDLNYHVQWYEFLLVAGWTSLFIYWSYVLLRKRDL